MSKINGILKENEDFFKFLVASNKAAFNRDKAIEECTEFIEAVVKNVTKHPTNPKTPTREDIKDEFGDFIYRGFIYLMELFPECTAENLLYQISYHMKDKINWLVKHKDSEKYKGGL